MKKQDKNNIASIKYIAINIFSRLKNTTCGLDAALKMTPLLYFLYKDHINFNPKNPEWEKRDALFFSQGYAAPVFYSTLHHFGYDLSIDDLKKYGQKNSKTPQILDSRITKGVEAITYPIGQDISQAVGFALSQKFLSNKLNDNLLPHTFVLCAEEAMHNGRTMESMSFAGHFGLENLTIINVSLYSNVKDRYTTFSDDLKTRAKSMNWNFEEITLLSNNDFKMFNKILLKCKKSTKPTLINIKTYNFSKLSLDELMCPLSLEKWASLEKEINSHNRPFNINKEIKNNFKCIIKEKIKKYKKINDKFISENKSKALFRNIIKKNRKDINLLNFFDIKLDKKYSISTHNHYCSLLDSVKKNVIDIRKVLHKELPSYVDGTGQILNSGIMQGYNAEFKKDVDKNIIYGVREDSIASIVSGMSIAKYMNPAWFSCLSFLNYSMSSIRNQAIQGHNVLNVIHYRLNQRNASPHQQIAEQLSLLRSTPNLIEQKPCDARETLLAYNCYLKAENHPTSILIPDVELKSISNVSEQNFAKGAYILKNENRKNFITVISSGLEMQYVYEAFKTKEDIRIVSMPSVSLFRQQPKSYKNKILGKREKTIFIDIGNDKSLYEFAHKIIGINDNVYAPDSNNFKITINKLINEIQK